MDGATTVSGHEHSASTAQAASSNHAKAADNLSTAAVKDGTVGDTSVDGLSKDLANTRIETTTAGTEFHIDRSNLCGTPFDVAAFHAQFGDGKDTTVYEQITKPAVIQETIKPSLVEEVHPIFHREHHVIHHQTRIQPVLQQTLLPAKHYVVIDGQKHEITGDAIMNHVVTQRDYIPMSVKPKIIVHQYVDNEPVLGPITNVGASLINKDVVKEHQRLINQSYEIPIAGSIDLPVRNVTSVNYMPGQVPVSTEVGAGPSTLAASSVDIDHSSPTSPSKGKHAPLDDAIERTSQRLPDQRTSLPSH